MLSPLVAQLLTLSGVLVGALVSFLLTSLGERRRWNQRQATRWDIRRMNAYADYGASVRRLVNVSFRVAAHRGFRSIATPLGLEEGQESLAATEAERVGRFEHVLLLGSPDVVTAARRWHQAAWHLERFARGLLSDHDEWHEARAAQARARKAFYDAARADLGIGSGELPEPEDLPFNY